MLPVFQALVLLATPVAALSCENASTLFEGESDATAVVYDGSCNARSFQVVRNSAVERSLNLSNLDVMDVRSYPRVYQLLLNNNEVEMFAPADSDNDMKALELASNSITDLASFRFPPRLKYLDLSFNSISTLSSSTPWPESGELQTLRLHGNSLSSVSVDTFTKLVALQSLSLSGTGISNLDDLMLPVSLRTLNASKNSFTSASTNFSNLPTSLQQIDLSENLLTIFPAIVSSLTTLVELNVASNGIQEIIGVTFASTLRKINFNDNPLSTIEICQSDISVFQSLTEFAAPSSISSTCANLKAKSQEIKGFYFCVVQDDDCGIASVSDSGVASRERLDSTSSRDAVQATRTNTDTSIFSAASIGIVGGMFLAIGVLISASIFGLLWYKRRYEAIDRPSQRAARKVNQERRYGSSGSNFLVFTASGHIARAMGPTNPHEAVSKVDNNSLYEDGTKGPGEDAAWSVYGSPLDKFHPVALLEPSPTSSSSFHGASTDSLQVRSKIKSKINLDDLLVFEIPPEEIQMRQALYLSTSKKSSKAALALSSVGVGHLRKMDMALFLAEYQGYKVVIQALMRSKKCLEQHFVEQIRLAASFDHASIVHFIGVTTGCSATASRQRGSSVAVPLDPYASYGPNTMLKESKSRYPTVGAPAWHLGVVFEYMQHGSLASMFEAERHCREGKGFCRPRSVAAATGHGNILSWYPVFGTSSTRVKATVNADWRCKLSIALDVAMALVYLHAHGFAHGRVCAHKVLVNAQGEAKLSAMDILLPSDFVARKEPTTDEFRESLRESARWTMQKITGMRPLGASKVTTKAIAGHRGHRRNANKSEESHDSGVSRATVDDTCSLSDHNVASNPTLEKGAMNSLKLSWNRAAQRDDVYAFGTLLWELDSMIAVEENLVSLCVPAGTGCNPQLLKFSADCPMELQELARQCWHKVPTERPDAIDVQEELVRVLEGRLTTSGHAMSTWTRPSYGSVTSALSLLSRSEVSSTMSSARIANDVSVADL